MDRLLRARFVAATQAMGDHDTPADRHKTEQRHRTHHELIGYRQSGHGLIRNRANH